MSPTKDVMTLPSSPGNVSYAASLSRMSAALLCLSYATTRSQSIATMMQTSRDTLVNEVRQGGLASK